MGILSTLAYVHEITAFSFDGKLMQATVTVDTIADGKSVDSRVFAIDSASLQAILASPTGAAAYVDMKAALETFLTTTGLVK